MAKSLFCGCNAKSKRRQPCTRCRKQPNNSALNSIDRKTDLLPLIDLKLSQLLSKLEGQQNFSVGDWLYSIDK